MEVSRSDEHMEILTNKEDIHILLVRVATMALEYASLLCTLIWNKVTTIYNPHYWQC